MRAQSLSQCRYRDLDAVLAHGRAAPDTAHDLFLRHQLAAGLDQEANDIEGAAADLDGIAVDEKLAPRRIDPERPEFRSSRFCGVHRHLAGKFDLSGYTALKSKHLGFRRRCPLLGRPVLVTQVGIPAGRNCTSTTIVVDCRMGAILSFARTVLQPPVTERAGENVGSVLSRSASASMKKRTFAGTIWLLA